MDVRRHFRAGLLGPHQSGVVAVQQRPSPVARQPGAAAPAVRSQSAAAAHRQTSGGLPLPCTTYTYILRLRVRLDHWNRPNYTIETARQKALKLHSTKCCILMNLRMLFIVCVFFCPFADKRHNRQHRAQCHLHRR